MIWRISPEQSQSCMRPRDVVSRANGASKRFAQQNLAAGGIYFRRGCQIFGVPCGISSRWGATSPARDISSLIWQISPRGVSRPGARHFFLGEKVPKTPPGTPRPPYRQTGAAFSPSISKMPLSPPAVRACSSFRAARSAARCPGGRRWCTAPCSAKCGRHCRLQVWEPSVSQAGRRSGKC